MQIYETIHPLCGNNSIISIGLLYNVNIDIFEEISI